MISAILVNFYSAHLISKAVVSLLDFRKPLEILVVDNTGLKEEQELLKRQIGEFATLIFSPENIGFARACNIAFKKARGKYICLLNPDAYFLPNALSVLRDFLEAEENAGAIAPKTYWDDHKKFLLPPINLPSPNMELVTRILGVNNIFEVFYSLWWRKISLKAWLAKKPVKQTNLSGGVALLKREAIEKAGGFFDERFFLYYEDTDLFLRIRKYGYQLYSEPRAEAVHHFSQCGRQFRTEKNRYMGISYNKFCEKHFKGHPAYKLARKLKNRNSKPVKERSRTSYLGPFSEPFCLCIPKKIKRKWLFEWSPNQSLYPAAGYMGEGKHFHFPEAWSLLDSGRYWVRISSLSQFPLVTYNYYWDKID